MDKKIKKSKSYSKNNFNSMSNYYSSSYSGTDIVAIFRFPDYLKLDPIVFGELKILSYSTYRDKFPVRTLGRVKAKGYTSGSRTVAGTLVFSVFDKMLVNRIIQKMYNSKSFNLLPDELPPFDIDLSFLNETGQRTSLTLVDIDLTEGNQILSVDQLGTDEQYSFVAIDILAVNGAFEDNQKNEHNEHNEHNDSENFYFAKGSQDKRDQNYLSSDELNNAKLDSAATESSERNVNS